VIIDTAGNLHGTAASGGSNVAAAMPGRLQSAPR
jgi:hypothetical protein